MKYDKKFRFRDSLLTTENDDFDNNIYYDVNYSGFKLFCKDFVPIINVINGQKEDEVVVYCTDRVVCDKVSEHNRLVANLAKRNIFVILLSNHSSNRALKQLLSQFYSKNITLLNSVVSDVDRHTDAVVDGGEVNSLENENAIGKPKVCGTIVGKKQKVGKWSDSWVHDHSYACRRRARVRMKGSGKRLDNVNAAQNCLMSRYEIMNQLFENHQHRQSVVRFPGKHVVNVECRDDDSSRKLMSNANAACSELDKTLYSNIVRVEFKEYEKRRPLVGAKRVESASANRMSPHVLLEKLGCDNVDVDTNGVTQVGGQEVESGGVVAEPPPPPPPPPVLSTVHDNIADLAGDHVTNILRDHTYTNDTLEPVVVRSPQAILDARKKARRRRQRLIFGSHKKKLSSKELNKLKAFDRFHGLKKLNHSGDKLSGDVLGSKDGLKCWESSRKERLVGASERPSSPFVESRLPCDDWAGSDSDTLSCSTVGSRSNDKENISNVALHVSSSRPDTCRRKVTPLKKQNGGKVVGCVEVSCSDTGRDLSSMEVIQSEKGLVETDVLSEKSVCNDLPSDVIVCKNGFSDQVRATLKLLCPLDCRVRLDKRDVSLSSTANGSLDGMVRKRFTDEERDLCGAKRSRIGHGERSMSCDLETWTKQENGLLKRPPTNGSGSECRTMDTHGCISHKENKCPTSGAHMHAMEVKCSKPKEVLPESIPPRVVVNTSDPLRASESTHSAACKAKSCHVKSGARTNLVSNKSRGSVRNGNVSKSKSKRKCETAGVVGEQRIERGPSVSVPELCVHLERPPPFKYQYCRCRSGQRDKCDVTGFVVLMDDMMKKMLFLLNFDLKPTGLSSVKSLIRPPKIRSCVMTKTSTR